MHCKDGTTEGASALCSSLPATLRSPHAAFLHRRGPQVYCTAYASLCTPSVLCNGPILRPSRMGPVHLRWSHPCYARRTKRGCPTVSLRNEMVRRTKDGSKTYRRRDEQSEAGGAEKTCGLRRASVKRGKKVKRVGGWDHVARSTTKTCGAWNGQLI